MTAGRADALIAATLRHFVAVAGLLAVVAYVSIYTFHLADVPIHSDGFSYYVYLPSWLLHHDATLQSIADDCCGGTLPEFTGVRRWPETGRWVNVHPIGVAIQMVPFFTAAHLLTKWSNLPPDGFSPYYQYAAGLAGLCAMLAGLAVLRELLSRHFAAFSYSAPHLWGVLFGVSKGLFFWSPVLLLSVVGVIVSRGWTEQVRAAAMLIFAVDTWLIASWSDWQFGGSYGHRGFTDGVALAAIFLAGFFEWSAARPRLSALVRAATAIAVLLAVAQINQ